MQGSVYSHDFRGVVNVDVTPLPDDSDKAVAVTIRRMTKYVLADWRSPIVQSAAASVIPVDGFTPVSLLRDLHTWIRRRVRFQEDDDTAGRAGFGTGNEVLIRPVDLLRMPDPVEDCDGFAMLAASMILALGDLLKIPYRPLFVTIAANERRPHEFSHVFLYVALEGRLISFDASHGPRLGWEHSHLGKKAVWPVGSFMFARTLGRVGRLGRLGQDTVVLSPDTYPPIVETSYPGLYPTLPPAPAPSSGINWNNLLPGLFSAGEQIGKQLTLPTGAYVVTGPGGQIMANQVPGAVPGGLNIGAGASSLGTIAFVGIGLLVLVSVFKSR